MNAKLSSPKAVVVDTSGGDQTFDPVLRGVDVFAPGTFHFDGVDNTEITVTFPDVADGGYYPTRWVVQIYKIYDDGTIADSDIIGLE